MRVKINSDSVKLWASSNDTHYWANRSGSSWPCSELSGRRLFAEFDSNGLLDLSIDGGRGEQDVDANELSSFCSDALRDKLPKEHPAYFVAVGQFD